MATKENELEVGTRVRLVVGTGHWATRRDKVGTVTAVVEIPTSDGPRYDVRFDKNDLLRGISHGQLVEVNE